MDKQVERLLERNPRTPQRVVRRRKLTPQLTKGNTLDAAAKHEKSLPDLQAVDKNHAKQFVPLASSREPAFPPSKPSLSTSGIDQAVASTSRKRLAQFPPSSRRGIYRLPFRHLNSNHPRQRHRHMLVSMHQQNNGLQMNMNRRATHEH